MVLMSVIEHDPGAFLQTVPTSNVILFPQYNPEDEQQSSQQLPKCASDPVKAKADYSRALVFWDVEFITLVDFLEIIEQ